jgi:hypothetical protein
MKKWKFYINEVELQLDIFNFDALKYVIGRDTEYWGYFREASIDKLVFLKQDAKTIKDFFESEGVNSEKNFTIKKLNTKMSCYEDFQTGVIDFYNYKEIYNNNNKLLKVEVDLVGNSEQQKIKTRQDLDLKIGRNTSVENQSVSTISAINVKYKTRPLKLEAFTGIAAAYIGVDISLGQLNPRDLTIPTQETNNNIEFYQNSALGESGINQVTNLLFQEMALREHLESQDTNFELDYNIDFQYNSLTSSPVVNGLKLKLQSYTYDGVNFTFVSSSILDQVDENPTPGSVQNSVNFTGTVLFDKNENLLYRLVVELSAQLFTIKFSQSIINYSYNELSFDSNHSSFLIYEVFQNLIEQITDKKDVFQSNLFGRVDLGYAAEGIASGIAVTNGLFLRNAELSDGEVVSLELNFQDLYKTLDSIYGLSLWFDGEKINIEKRTDVFGTNEIEIEPQEITRELFTKLLYTNVKVGNKQIKYENTNGTNEYNTVLQFSSPLRIKANNLDLVTKYNTDYLGVELAKRLSFASDANVDTKYDDKVFLCTVLKVHGVYETILGLSGGFTLVEGVILPTYAGNLDFSPKRMLLNNSDLINSAFWKNETDSLRFEKSQNLAALVTQKTGETSTVEELSDLLFSQMTEAKFIPMLWNFKVSENDLWKVMNNQLDIFKFALGCETKYGYLWKAEIQNDLGEITLIEKRTLSTPAPPFTPTTASLIFDGISEQIEIPSDASLQFSGAFTISLWIYGTNFNYIRNKTIAEKSGEWFIKGNNSTQLYIRIFTNGSNYLQGRLASANPDSQWNNYIISYDGATSFDIFRNNDGLGGTINTQFGTFTGITPNANPLTIGDNTPCNLSYFSLWNRELTNLEKIELYNSGALLDISSLSFAGDCVSWYRLDQTNDLISVDGVADEIGSNNGTALNMNATNIDSSNYPT